MKILNCLSHSIIFLEIQSCDKIFHFPKNLFDLSDVGKVVLNKGDPIRIHEDPTRENWAR